MSRTRQDNRGDALALCEAGFAIYPLIPGTKSPAIGSPHPPGSPERGRCRGECGLLGHGFYDARADAEWADRYWTAHPDYGIAGRPVPGTIVLDVDPRHGGDIALAELEAVHGALPETFTVLSGRGDGGRHLWFSGVDGPVRSRLCPGVDVIAHHRGGAVMPPSLHWSTGRPYRYLTPIADIAAVPTWVRELTPRPDVIRKPSRPGRRLSPMQVRRRGRGLVAAVANAVEGQRRKTLYWAASRAAEDSLLGGDSGLKQALVDAARAAGLDADETGTVIGDVTRAATGWEL